MPGVKMIVSALTYGRAGDASFTVTMNWQALLKKSWR